jgi:hypothetical protein
MLLRSVDVLRATQRYTLEHRTLTVCYVSNLVWPSVFNICIYNYKSVYSSALRESFTALFGLATPTLGSAALIQGTVTRDKLFPSCI